LSGALDLPKLVERVAVDLGKVELEPFQGIDDSLGAVTNIAANPLTKPTGRTRRP